jgi:hypothetical protein
MKLVFKLMASLPEASIGGDSDVLKLITSNSENITIEVGTPKVTVKKEHLCEAIDRLSAFQKAEPSLKFDGGADKAPEILDGDISNE